MLTDLAMTELITIEGDLRERLPGASEAPIQVATAICGLTLYVVFADMHLDAKEHARLERPLARITCLPPEARRAVVELVRAKYREYVSVDVHACVGLLRASVPIDERARDFADIGDALIELACAAGSLATAHRPIMRLGIAEPNVPVAVSLEDRARELGLELPERPSVTTSGPDDVGWDHEACTLGAGMNEIRVEWTELERLEPIDPWPRLALRWRNRWGVGDACMTARRGRESFADRVVELVAFAEEHCLKKLSPVVVPGWAAVADLDWEEVPSFPRPPEVRRAGAYRTAAVHAPPEPILATRAAPSSYETMMLWLASTPDTPWREHTGDIVVTDRWFYARRRDGRVHRLPLVALRCRLGARDGVYVFGRRTRVVLPQRNAPCPVAQHLDALLRDRDQDSVSRALE